MARAGVAAARPCADGSAIFFSPGGLAGLSGTRFSVGVTAIGAQGGFTDDFLNHRTDLDNPLIPVPNAYITHQFSPKLTAGVGVYAPYGLETRWPVEGFDGRFLGYNTRVRSIYIQPTIGYQISPKLQFGIGVAYITSKLELHQRADLSTQSAAPGVTFAQLGLPTGTDFADAALEATGSGFAVNFGAIWKVSDRLSIGGHWLTRKTIDYDGTAVFEQIPTNTHLAANNPLGLPGGTLIDTLAPIAGLFGPGGPLDDQSVKTSLIMPPQGSIGFAYKSSDKWSFMADYHYVVWGWFSTVDIDFENPATPDLALHPSNKDTHGFRFGTEYQYSPKIQLRGGYLYHTGASPAQFVTPLLPEGARNEFTIGAGIELTPKLHADLGYQYIRQNDRRGTVNLAVGNTGLYQFSAHLFGIGAAYTF
jgi:long-chain fatty acid transport protein